MGKRADPSYLTREDAVFDELERTRPVSMGDLSQIFMLMLIANMALGLEKRFD